jgi:UDP-N-acetylmuramate: L-alanyl-gamma-D-glutamyl-meso-diaminopimelate ligase
MNLVPGNGRLIAGWDNAHVRDVVTAMGQKLFTQIETFGTSEDAEWQARDIDHSGELTRFRVLRAGRDWAAFQIPLIGDFNVLNSLAVIIAADAWGIERQAIADALATFRNVRRRAEVRGEESGVTVIDDFAHHPTAVRETLRALRSRYVGRRLIALFEPRSWSSRLAVFQNEYPPAFAAADFVVIANVFDIEKVREKGAMLSTARLIKDIAAQDKPAVALTGEDEIIGYLMPELRPGDVVAIMSNGGFGGIHEKLLAALKRQDAVGRGHENPF